MIKNDTLKNLTKMISKIRLNVLKIKFKHFISVRFHLFDSSTRGEHANSTQEGSGGDRTQCHDFMIDMEQRFVFN